MLKGGVKVGIIVGDYREDLKDPEILNPMES